MNLDKYLGVGGHFEEGETPEECVLRELLEETGIGRGELKEFDYRGIVTFVSNEYGTEYMHVFTASLDESYDKIPKPCDEGEFCWVDIGEIYNLSLWEGDRIMFDALFEEESKEKRFFSMKLCYEGDKLVSDVENFYGAY